MLAHPHIFVSHGTHDRVLPIDRCRRAIVPRLERAGYDVHYQEFDGPHTVPEAIAIEALDWGFSPKSVWTCLHDRFLDHEYSAI